MRRINWRWRSLFLQRMPDNGDYYNRKKLCCFQCSRFIDWNLIWKCFEKQNYLCVGWFAELSDGFLEQKILEDEAGLKSTSVFSWCKGWIQLLRSSNRVIEAIHLFFVQFSIILKIPCVLTWFWQFFTNRMEKGVKRTPKNKNKIMTKFSVLIYFMTCGDYGQRHAMH